MKNFIAVNDDFVCQNCGKKNLKLKGGYRNHCGECLYSLHVDEEIPGDRLSECMGLMYPQKIDHDGKKGWIIFHKCEKCGKIIPNKTAEDDDFDLIVRLSHESTGM